MIKSAINILSLDPVFKRQVLNEEKNIFKKVVPYVTPIFIGFSIVDYYTVEGGNLFEFIILRLTAVITSTLLYYVLRGNAKYGLRKLACFGPYLLYIQYITIKYQLALSPYYAGLALIIFPAAIYLPTKLSLSLRLYTISLSPFLYFLINKILDNNLEYLNPLLMSIGMIVLCSVCSDQMLRESINRIKNKIALSNEVHNRGRIINQKVNEITSMKAFEKQFSPQVIKEIQKNPNLYDDMRKEDLVIIVFDIVESTKKSNELAPENYKYVIEEIFDLINSVCIKWDITIDKFTGDGAQVFAGSPTKYMNDLERAVNASVELLEKLEKRQNSLILKWKDKVELKVAISSGSALVGFLGKGSVKSFTAIGNSVSFTHRLCSKANSNEILIFCDDKNLAKYINIKQYEIKNRVISDMKGISHEVNAKALNPLSKKEMSVFYGICDQCGSNLSMDAKQMIPRVVCLSCKEAELI